jgi:hypothetical protein
MRCALKARDSFSMYFVWPKSIIESFVCQRLSPYINDRTSKVVTFKSDEFKTRLKLVDFLVKKNPSVMIIMTINTDIPNPLHNSTSLIPLCSYTSVVITPKSKITIALILKRMFKALDL